MTQIYETTPARVTLAWGAGLVSALLLALLSSFLATRAALGALGVPGWTDLMADAVLTKFIDFGPSFVALPAVWTLFHVLGWRSAAFAAVAGGATFYLTPKLVAAVELANSPWPVDWAALAVPRVIEIATGGALAILMWLIAYRRNRSAAT